MTVTMTRPDGLSILTTAPLSQLAHDETLLKFADGLVPLAPGEQANLAETLRRLGH